MKPNALIATLPLLFAMNAIAAEQLVPDYSHTLNRGLVVAVTEPGTAASDTAWLLSKQTAEGRQIPILLVLDKETRNNTLNGLKLDAVNLPALILLDANGKERGRVVSTSPALKAVKTVTMN